MTYPGQAPMPMSPDALRSALPYAEEHIRGALVSAFDRLSTANPAAAPGRLAAVCRLFNLADPMTPDGTPTPDSRFFDAARQIMAAAPGRALDTPTVLQVMANSGASVADLGTVHGYLRKQADQWTQRPFETYAAALQHLRVTRLALDKGADIAPNVAMLAGGQATELINRIYAAEATDQMATDTNPKADRVNRVRRGFGTAAKGALLTAIIAAPAGSGAVGAAVVTAAVLAVGNLIARVRERTVSGRPSKQQRTAATAAKQALGWSLDLGQNHSSLAGHRPAPTWRQPPRPGFGRRA